MLRFKGKKNKAGVGVSCKAQTKNQEMVPNGWLLV